VPLEPVATAVEVEAKVPIASKAKVSYRDKASFDFRMVHLDPATVGTTQRCDVASITISKDDQTRPISVRCMAGPMGSIITFARSSDVIAALVERTQIEVTVDAEGLESQDGDARATLVKVIGELEPPERPSRCLCDRDRHDELRPKPPEGWNFSLYEKDHQKHWGKTHVCIVAQVHDVMRSSPDAREYSSGRVFDPETLPYAARVYCSSPSGSHAVIVGSRSAQALLSLEQGQAIEIDLGWVTKWSYHPTGKLGATIYRPGRDYD
jgi:hypothetical protein